MPNMADPREDAYNPAGLGDYGNDFTPSDAEFQRIRTKARAVLEKRDTFTYTELQQIVARFLVGR